MTQLSTPIVVPKHRSVWALPLSVMAHAGLIAALVLSVAWKSEPPAALQAELWEAILSIPPVTVVTPTPEVKTTPVLEPRPAPPVVKSPPPPEPEAIAPKVIKKPIKKPNPDPKPAPEPDPPKKPAKPVPKVAVKPVAKPETKPAPKVDPKPKSDTATRDAARAKEIARMNQLSQNVGLGGAPAVGTPQAGTVQGLGAGWGAKLKACVQPNLRYSDASGDNPRVVFVVRLSPAGVPSDAVVNKSSGNPAFDAAVSRALLRCDPFPKPESGNYPASVTVAYRLND